MPSVTYAECHIYKPFMLSVIMLNVIMLSVVMLSVVAPEKETERKRVLENDVRND